MLLFSCHVLIPEGQSLERCITIVTFNYCFKRNFHSKEKSVHNIFMTLNFRMSVFLTKIFYNVRFCTRNAQMILYLEPQIDYIFIAMIICKTFQTNILPLLMQTILYCVFFRYDYDKSDCNVVDSISDPLHICLNYLKNLSLQCNKTSLHSRAFFYSICIQKEIAKLVPMAFVLSLNINCPLHSNTF